MARALAAAVAALAVGGCFLSADPRYCEDSSECGDPARPFCDVAGEFEESGFHGHTCIEVPGGSCDASSECPAGLPICELAENECRLCMSSDECVERGDGLGVCAGSGRCVECEQSIDCPAGQPICGDSECGACEDDDECEARDPQAPVCDGGACRGCESAADCTDPSAPICDPGSGVCRGCQAHGECASGVCDSAAAECIAEADVLYVEPGGTDVGDCPRATPCATIGYAASQVAGARNWVAIATGTYAENLAVTGQEINFAGPTDAVIDPVAANQPVIAVLGAAQVKIDGLTLRDASGVSGRGVNCTGGSTATIRNAKLDDNAGAGVAADDCTLTVERSTVSANTGGGLDVDDSSFTVRNNFIVGNGSAVAGSLFGGMSIANGIGGRTQVLEHNTIADNVCNNVAGAARGVLCTTTTPMTAHSNILFGGLGAAQTAGNCSHRYSIVEGGLAGEGNITDAPMYVSAGTDYHLAPGSPGIDVGDPASVVLEDVDGNRRPFNGRVDIGADEVIP